MGKHTHQGYISTHEDTVMETNAALQQYLHRTMLSDPLVTAGEFVTLTARRTGNVIDISHVIGSRNSYDEDVTSRVREISVYSPTSEIAAELMDKVRELLHVEAYHDAPVVDSTYNYATGHLDVGNPEGNGRIIDITAPEEIGK